MAIYDLASIKYRIIATLSNGTSIDLTDICEAKGWEDNKDELAVRLNLTLRDTEYAGGRIANALPLCTALYLFSDYGNGESEVWRGTIWEWEYSGVEEDRIVLTGYDMLYYASKSEDYFYWAKGRKTQAVIEAIAKKWNIPIGNYQGPDEKHGKLVYRKKKIAQAIKDVLSDAEDLGGKKCFARASQGKMDIVPYGSNEIIYMFEADKNIYEIRDKYSMVDLITRIVITGKESRAGRPKIEATINGSTEYGILQSIQARGSDSMADARKAAAKTMREKGQPKRTLRITAPDFPAIRKGDRIYVSAGTLQGFFHVMGVAHNATQMQMSMEVEAVEQR